VVVRQRGDDRDHGPQHIGGIQPASEPDLDGGGLHACPGEVGEGDGRDDLVLVRSAPFRRGLDLVDPLDEIGLRDRFAIHLDALVKWTRWGEVYIAVR